MTVEQITMLFQLHGYQVVPEKQLRRWAVCKTGCAWVWYFASDEPEEIVLKVLRHTEEKCHSSN